MTFEQLHYFCTIVEFSSFSFAADDLNISQSALSKQIIKLEKELDILLFDRTHRKISLTTYGKTFYEEASKILKDYEQMMHKVKILKDKEGYTIHIASLPISSSFNFSKILNNLQSYFPGFKIHFDEIEEKELNALISKDIYDIFILRNDTNKKLENYIKHKLFSDHFVALVPPENKELISPKISLSSLDQKDVVLPPSYTTISKTFFNICKKRHVKPKVVQHSRLETSINLVSNNQYYIAVTTEQSLQAFHLNNLEVCYFDEPLNCDLYIYYRKNSSHYKKIKRIVDAIINFSK